MDDFITYKSDLGNGKSIVSNMSLLYIANDDNKVLSEGFHHISPLNGGSKAKYLASLGSRKFLLDGNGKKITKGLHSLEKSSGIKFTSFSFPPNTEYVGKLGSIYYLLDKNGETLKETSSLRALLK